MRPKDAELSAILVEDGGELIGIAPFYALGRDLRLLAGDFAGNVEPLAAAGRETDVATAIAATLGDEVSPRTIALDQQGAAPDWPGLMVDGWSGPAPRLQPGPKESCPFVTIVGPDLDGWMATKSGSFRRETRRRQKRFDETGASVREATSETLESDVGELLRLHRQRLAGRGGTLLSRDGNQPMLVAAGRELLPSGRFRLLCLEIDGATVGAQLLVAGGGEVCAWNSGFDEEYAKHSPIMHLLIHALADAIERGERRLSLGPGSREYKLRLADGEDALDSCTLMPRGRGYAGVRIRSELRSWASSTRRRLRQRVRTEPS
jgi:CelD/BcsL family acetyltransferase involved in cellulose biosynthesis